MSLYSFGRPIVHFFYKLCFRYEVRGREFIPEEGGMLICSNHQSDFDSPLIGLASPRELSYLAKSELFKIPLFGSLVKRLNAVPIRRGKGDREALRTVVTLLNKDHALLIFPEGSRNKTDQLRKGMSGAGYFALKSNAAVIPCAIIGNYKMGRKMKVVFGPPVDTDQMKADHLKASEASAIIMMHIQRLLDENNKTEAGPSA